MSHYFPGLCLFTDLICHMSLTSSCQLDYLLLGHRRYPALNLLDATQGPPLLYQSLASTGSGISKRDKNPTIHFKGMALMT